MDIVAIISTVASLLGTLSIWEAVKYFLNRKTNKRMEEAEADSKEFATLRDMIEFLQGQLKEQEARYADQTERLRHTQDENFRLLEEKALLEIRMATGGAAGNAGGIHGKEGSAALRGRKKQEDGGKDEAGIQDIEGVFGKGGTAGKGKAKSAGGNTGGPRGKKKEKKEDKKGGQA